jgi:GNAT superfamily N-acetyltransferase
MSDRVHYAATLMAAARSPDDMRRRLPSGSRRADSQSRGPRPRLLIMNAIVTSLEMTSRAQLVRGLPAPAEIAFDEAGPESADLVRDTYNRIWEPLAAVGRTGWSAEQWARELARPVVHAWLARIHNDIAGLAELETEAGNAVGIVVFGLVPDLVGKGFGAAFLTDVIERAWELRTSPDGQPARVWLETSSLDHAHALRNYTSRGFRVFATGEH